MFGDLAGDFSIDVEVRLLRQGQGSRNTRSTDGRFHMIPTQRNYQRPLLAKGGPMPRPKQQNCQIRAADGRFHIVRCNEFISGQAKLLFYQALAKRIAALSRPASRSGRFIKADGRFIKAGKLQWQFYQASASSDGRFIKASPNGHFIKGRRMASLPRPVS